MASMESIPLEDRMVVEARIKSNGVGADLSDLTIMQVDLYDSLASKLPNSGKTREILIGLLNAGINQATSFNRFVSNISQ